MKLSEHFNSKEFLCPCGCGHDKIRQSHIDLLEEARRLADIPFNINSGCRCESYNERIGGVDSSAHVAGFASDIKATTSGSRHEILASLIAVGFTRIGMSKNFIHVDNDPTKPARVTWVY